MTIAPGFEDPHVHFRDPGQTYEAGIHGARASAAAAFSGVIHERERTSCRTLPRPSPDGAKVTAGVNRAPAKRSSDAGADIGLLTISRNDYEHASMM
ncbi:MAG: hypothetical protein ACLTUO_00505 [Bifidobacterium sp.]